MILTGALGSVLMRLLHRGEQPASQEQPKPKPATQHKAPPASETPKQPTPQSTPSKKAGGKAKKAGKK